MASDATPWDDADKDEEGWYVDDPSGEDDWTCAYPDTCLMLGDHTRDECHTVEMLEAFLDEQGLTPAEMQATLQTLIILDTDPGGHDITTARDAGDSWWVQEWEYYDTHGDWYWRAVLGYPIDKAWVMRLAEAQDAQGLMTAETPSGPGSCREARGILPYDPTQPKPEEIIRRMRDA